MYTRILILSSFILISASLKAEEPKYEKEIIVKGAECLEYKGITGKSASSYTMRFYNNCSQKVMANVCVEERPGKFRLYSRKLFGRGSWYIKNYEGSKPVSLHYSSSATGGIPGPCQKTEEK